MYLTWIWAITENFWVIFIIQEILNMGHFMMNGNQILVSHLCTHFDTKRNKSYYTELKIAVKQQYSVYR